MMLFVYKRPISPKKQQIFGGISGQAFFSVPLQVLMGKDYWPYCIQNLEIVTIQYWYVMIGS